MPVDEWKREKAALRSKDAMTFVGAAQHLLIQRRHPELRAFVLAADAQALKIVLDSKRGADVRARAIGVLERVGSPKLKAVAGVFVDAPVKVVAAAAEALSGATGAPVVSENAVTRLIAVIQKAGDWSPQYDAVRTIKYFKDPRVVPTLVAALGHAQQAVRREALVGLGEQRAVEALPQLIAKLGEGQDQEVVAASRALERIGTPEALKSLKNLATYRRALKQAKDEIYGRFAVGALAQFQVPTVEADLLKLTRSDDAEIAQGAIAGLVKRRCESAAAEIAKRAIKSSDAQYFGRSLTALMVGLGAIIDTPNKAAVKALGATLSTASAEVLTEIFEGNVYPNAHDADSVRRMKAWIAAVAANVKPPAKRQIIVDAFDRA